VFNGKEKAGNLQAHLQGLAAAEEAED
jgi:hypothetical protein